MYFKSGTCCCTVKNVAVASFPGGPIVSPLFFVKHQISLSPTAAGQFPGQKAFGMALPHKSEVMNPEDICSKTGGLKR